MVSDYETTTLREEREIEFTASVTFMIHTLHILQSCHNHYDGR